MSEGSFPWDCDAGGDGDAGAAIVDTPYSSGEWALVDSRRFASDRADGMVVPDYGDNLRVYESTPNAMTVEVGTGAMFVQGRYYENDAVRTLAIAASDPVLPRLDRVVVRISIAAQTIRLAVLTGTPNAAPVLPSLTTTAATWEVDLAHIYVQGNILIIDNENIDDKRVFYNNGLQAPSLMGYNLLANSEFMAFSALSIASPSTYPPDYWRLVLTPTAIATATKLGQMSRGRAIQVTVDAANEGIYQTIIVKPSTMYAFRGCYQVTGGDVGKVNITTNSGAPVGLTRELRRTGTNLEFLCYYTTEADATTLTLQLLNLNAGDIVQWGQFIIAEGYEAGLFREVRETLIYEWAAHTDTDYDGDNKAVSTYTIDFDTNFGGFVLPGSRAVFLAIMAKTSTGALVTFRNVTTNRALIEIDKTSGADFWSVGGCIALDINRQIEVDVATNPWNGAYIRVTGIEV